MRFALATDSGGMREGGWVTSTSKDGTENVAEADIRGGRAGGGVAASPAEIGGILKEQQARKGGKLGGAVSNKPEVVAAVAAAAKKVADTLGKAAAAQGGGSTAATAAALAAAAAKLEKQPAADKGQKKSARGEGDKSDRDKPTTPKPTASGGTTPKAAKSPGGHAPMTPKKDEVDYDKLREELRAKVATARESSMKLVSKKPLTEEAQKVNRYVRNEAHRPAGKQEEMPSRHDNTPIATLMLMFNCNRCSFELSAGDLLTLPESEALDIKSLLNNTTLGRVKIAPEKGTPFVDRVEFPNEWRVGDEHGLIHDGLQGDGQLEMRLEWKAEKPDGSLQAHTAIIKANAWLAYGCAEGARMMMRKATDTMGRCCTVQRTLRDDSVVVRVDGMMGESTVDPTPLTVVRTSNPRHQAEQRLLYLQDKACVDAVVEPWGGSIDVKEGSRHKLRVLSQTTNGWVTWKLKDGTEQLKPPKEASPGDFSVLQVATTKPLKVPRPGGEPTGNATACAAPTQFLPMLTKLRSALPFRSPFPLSLSALPFRSPIPLFRSALPFRSPCRCSPLPPTVRSRLDLSRSCR